RLPAEAGRLSGEPPQAIRDEPGCLSILLLGTARFVTLPKPQYQSQSPAARQGIMHFQNKRCRKHALAGFLLKPVG
ncbi:MAG: hypothetical protein IJA75_09160, partial [Oscillospiraceae bacterium]|nr:hypothetical protein [Oscillospiraceae bacterium]